VFGIRLVLTPQHLDLDDWWMSYQSVESEVLYSFHLVDSMLISTRSFSFLNRAITLENQLVILATSVTDAGGYYVQAVNEKNGENKTSPFIHLSVASEYPNSRKRAVIPKLQAVLAKVCPIKRALLTKDWIFKAGQIFLHGLEHVKLLVQ